MAKSTTFRGAPKPFGATGHFDEPTRHSLQAKGIKTGHFARPTLPEKLQLIKNPEIKSVYLKDDIKAIFKFEDMNYDYIDSQIEGLRVEATQSHTFSIPYMQEKMQNILSILEQTLGNFESRVQDPEVKKEWLKFYADWKQSKAKE